MLQLIPALLLILLQSGAEPDSARIRSHALSLMMGSHVRTDLGEDLDKAVGENLSDAQISVLLGILADEPIPAPTASSLPEKGRPFAAHDERLPASAAPSSVRSRDGPSSL